MAQLLLEPFVGYALSDILEIFTQKDAGSQPLDSFSTSGSARSGAQYLQIGLNTGGVGGTGNKYRIVPQFPTVTGNVAIAGVRLYGSSWSQMGGGTTRIFSWLKSGSEQCYVSPNADGTIRVVRGSTELGRSTVAIPATTWEHLQAKVTIHPSTGTVDLVLNGTTNILSLTGVNTANTGSAGWNEFAIGNVVAGNSTGAFMRMMDLWLCDGDGSAWNDFMGDLRLDLCYVTANGTNNGSTPSTGTDRYATVDEASMNGDTDYNTFAAVDDMDTYVVQDAAVAGADIKGIEIRAQLRKTDAGAAGVKLCALINGTVYLGTEQGIASSYTVVRESLGSGINPATSTAWTDTGVSGFNASEFGAKKTS